MSLWAYKLICEHRNEVWNTHVHICEPIRMNTSSCEHQPHAYACVRCSHLHANTVVKNKLMFECSHERLYSDCQVSFERPCDCHFRMFLCRRWQRRFFRRCMGRTCVPCIASSEDAWDAQSQAQQPTTRLRLRNETSLFRSWPLNSRPFSAVIKRRSDSRPFSAVITNHTLTPA